MLYPIELQAQRVTTLLKIRRLQQARTCRPRDPEGKYLGVVAMPARFQPRLFHADKTYGVWRDELDVQ